MAINWDLTPHFFNSEWGQVATTYRTGTVYACKYPTDVEVTYDLEGKTTKIDFALLFKYADLATPPAQEELVVIGGITYKILHYTIDSQAKTYKCYMGQRYA